MNRKIKKIGTGSLFVIFAAVGLARCGFEAGAFSSVTVKLPDDVALSTLIYPDGENPVFDDAMVGYIHKIKVACWKTGWRSLVREMLSTGPDSIQLTVSDSFTGTRVNTIVCKNL